MLGHGENDLVVLMARSIDRHAIGVDGLDRDAGTKDAGGKRDASWREPRRCRPWASPCSPWPSHPGERREGFAFVALWSSDAGAKRLQDALTQALLKPWLAKPASMLPGGAVERGFDVTATRALPPAQQAEGVEQQRCAGWGRGCRRRTSPSSRRLPWLEG